MKIEVEIWEIKEGKIKTIKFPDGTIGHLVDFTTTNKTCSKCGESKPISDFKWRGAGSKDGFHAQCKICLREKEREWREGKYAKPPTVIDTDKQGKIVGYLHGVSIHEKVVKQFKFLDDRDLQKLYLENEFPTLSPATRGKYLNTYRKWVKDGARIKRRKLKNKIGYVGKVPIDGDFVKKIRNLPETEQLQHIKEQYQHVKTKTQRNYHRAYRKWIEDHPTVNQIAEKLSEKEYGGKVLAVVNGVGIKEDYFRKFKQHPTKQTLRKIYKKLKASSLKTYFNAYQRYLDETTGSTITLPSDLKMVKATMVNLWRENLPITTKNIRGQLTDLSHRQLSTILNALIKNKEARYNKKNDVFEVVL